VPGSQGEKRWLADDCVPGAGYGEVAGAQAGEEVQTSHSKTRRFRWDRGLAGAAS